MPKAKPSRTTISRASSMAKKSVLKPLPPPPPPPPSFVGHQTDKLPGLLDDPKKFVVLSQSGKYEEFYRSLSCAFTKSKCILLVTPWGQYGIFNVDNSEKWVFYVCDACSCTMNILRYLDLTQGTAGFLYFQDVHHIIEYVLNNRFKCEKYNILPKSDAIEKIIFEFCAKGGPDVYKVCNKRGEMLDFYEYGVKECKLQEMIKECPKIKQKCSRGPKPKKRESQTADGTVKVEEDAEEKDCFKRLGIELDKPAS